MPAAGQGDSGILADGRENRRGAAIKDRPDRARGPRMRVSEAEKGDHLARETEKGAPGVAGLGGYPAESGFLPRGPGFSTAGVSQL